MEDGLRDMESQAHHEITPHDDQHGTALKPPTVSCAKKTNTNTMPCGSMQAEGYNQQGTQLAYRTYDSQYCDNLIYSNTVPPASIPDFVKHVSHDIFGTGGHADTQPGICEPAGQILPSCPRDFVTTGTFSHDQDNMPGIYIDPRWTREDHGGLDGPEVQSAASYAVNLNTVSGFKSSDSRLEQGKAFDVNSISQPSVPESISYIDPHWWSDELPVSMYNPPLEELGDIPFASRQKSDTPWYPNAATGPVMPPQADSCNGLYSNRSQNSLGGTSVTSLEYGCSSTLDTRYTKASDTSGTPQGFFFAESYSRTKIEAVSDDPYMGTSLKAGRMER
jgi:hypothetical protein